MGADDIRYIVSTGKLQLSCAFPFYFAAVRQLVVRQLVHTSGVCRQIVACWARCLFSLVKEIIDSFSLLATRGEKKKIIKDLWDKASSTLCSSAAQTNQAAFGHLILVLIPGAACCEQRFKGTQIMQSGL